MNIHGLNILTLAERGPVSVVVVAGHSPPQVHVTLTRFDLYDRERVVFAEFLFSLN